MSDCLLRRVLDVEPGRESQRPRCVEPMTPAEAKAALLRHAGWEENHGDGLLAWLRPYRGLNDDHFLEILHALYVLQLDWADRPEVDRRAVGGDHGHLPDRPELDRGPVRRQDSSERLHFGRRQGQARRLAVRVRALRRPTAPRPGTVPGPTSARTGTSSTGTDSPGGPRSPPRRWSDASRNTPRTAKGTTPRTTRSRLCEMLGAVGPAARDAGAEPVLARLAARSRFPAVRDAATAALATVRPG